MASITSINVGATANDGTGDQLRIAGTKTNANVTALNTELIAATTKLATIEIGASADLSAAEILAALLTLDGDGSGVDADTLDGQHAAAFATAAQGALADSALQSADIGDTVQAHDAVLDATTASFTTADETKLDGIEASADVTDATNVAAAGAVMTTGAQLVSSEADNTLLANPKFWVGEEADEPADPAGTLVFILEPA